MRAFRLRLSGVTTGGGAVGGRCPPAQHARGRKTASPNKFYDYFKDHKSAFDKFSKWVNSSIGLSQVRKKLSLFCHTIGYSL